MTAGPIQVATIAQLLSDETGSAGSVSHVETLCQGGAYLRRRPFRLDIGALDTAHRAGVEQYFASTASMLEPVRHLALLDALVAGQGSVVTRDHFLIHESAYEFLADERVPDGLTDAGAGGFTLRSAPARTIDRPTLLLKRPWNTNYGHWLVDSAAILALGAGLTLPSGWQLAVGRQDSEAMQRIVRQTLDTIAPGIAVIELPDDEVWRFSELHYVSPVHVPLKFMLPAGLSALRALVLRESLVDDRPRHGIYVTRGDHGARRLRNEDQVIALCREFGLEVVQPEQWPLAEQARRFHRADLVVGVKGAALTNALFCSGRTHLVVLSPGDFPDPFYWDLTAPAGVAYSEIFGVLQGRDRPIGHNAFTAPIDGLRAILEACVADLAKTEERSWQ
jgi:capsular polysaccharide biosynthesis protein